MPIVYCFHDQQSWGSEVACEISKRKQSSQMMSHSVQVTDEVGTTAFMHVSEREQMYVKELSAEIAQKHNVVQIPSAKIIELHDNLTMQYQQFGQWMPSTYLFLTAEQATSHLNQLPYPIISRSSSNAQQNTRILHDTEEAMLEISKAFSEAGMELLRGGVQKDYVLWQPAWETQGHIYHVFMLGKKYAVITTVPADTNPTEPQCLFKPVEVLDERFEELLKYAYAFTTDMDFDFVSMEIAPARDRVRKVSAPFILSIAASWPFKWFERGGMIFESEDGNEWTSTGIPAVKVWNVVADWIISGGNNAS